MIGLSFIGDGPRDRETVPRLVARILNEEIEARSNQLWTEIRLNRGRGFVRKLAFVIAAARADGLAGVVATVDQDAMPDRMPALIEARRTDRERNPSLPVALGEARPHGEAWLLDDPVAVRDALGLDASVAIAAVHRCPSPKQELEALHAMSNSKGDRFLESFARIAELLEVTRCAQAGRTGFGSFVEEIRTELGSSRKT